MGVKDLLNRLTSRSKEARVRRDTAKTQDSNLDSIRERQAHYRAVTQTDASGKDTRP